LLLPRTAAEDGSTPDVKHIHRLAFGGASLLREANPAKRFSAIFHAREKQKVLRELLGFLCGLHAAQRICCSSRLISFLSSPPTLCFAR